jgi:integrase
MSTLPRGIRSRGDKFFVDLSLNGQRRTATCDTLAQAVVERDKLRAELEGGKLGRKSWTIGYTFERVCAAPHNVKKKLSGWQGAKAEAHLIVNGKLCVEFFGHDTKLDEIALPRIEEFTASLRQKKNSNGTINRKLAALSKMFTFALARQGCSFKPEMPRTEEGKSRHGEFDEREEALIINTLRQWEKHDHADVCEVLIDTGLRTGELWKLKRSEIDFRSGTLVLLDTKNDSNRIVPMTARVRKIMERRCAGGGQPFPFSNDWLHHAWVTLRTHLGRTDDPVFVPHTFRHTCAVRLVRKGVRLNTVMKWLGHSNIQTTMIYADAAPNDLNEARDLLDSAVEAPKLKVVK